MGIFFLKKIKIITFLLPILITSDDKERLDTLARFQIQNWNYSENLDSFWTQFCIDVE